MSILLREWLATPVLENSVRQYLLALSTFFLVWLALKLVQKIFIQRLDRLSSRTFNRWDDAIVNLVKTIKPQFYWFIAFYLALQVFNPAGVVDRVLDVVLIAWVVYQIIAALKIIIDYLIKVKFVKQDDRASEVVSSILSGLATIALWVLGILFVLSNVGLNVNSLIAGLGITGLAVALAAQNILGDLFSSLAIYFDRPFAPGEFIEVGDDKGTVLKVGIKTTRLRALSGEEIVISNRDITAARIKNHGRMSERRVEVRLSISRDTDSKIIEAIPPAFEKIVNAIQPARFKRAHLAEMNEKALVFDLVYFVKSNEYSVYADVHHQILLAVNRYFAEQGIKFA